MEDYFVLNRESFEREYRGMLETLGREARLLVQFPIILPFHIPFPGMTGASFDLGDRVATLLFSTLTTGQAVHAGVVRPDPIKLPAKEALDFGSMVRVVRIPEWEPIYEGLFLLHHDVPYERKEIPLEAGREVLQRAHALHKELNPFMLSSELLLGARRHASSGAFSEAVVSLQSAVEVFLARWSPSTSSGEITCLWCSERVGIPPKGRRPRDPMHREHCFSSRAGVLLR